MMCRDIKYLDEYHSLTHLHTHMESHFTTTTIIYNDIKHYSLLAR